MRRNENGMASQTAEGATRSGAAVRGTRSAASLRVPLVVDVGTGANWDQAH